MSEKLGIRSLATAGQPQTLTGEWLVESWYCQAGKMPLGVIKAQHVEQAIETPQYLIGTTEDGNYVLRLSPAAPLPL